jgi:hypothetical protein
MKKILVLSLCLGVSASAFAKTNNAEIGLELNSAQSSDFQSKTISSAKSAAEENAYYPNSASTSLSFNPVPREIASDEEALYAQMKVNGEEIPQWLREAVFGVKTETNSSSRVGGNDSSDATLINFAAGTTYTDSDDTSAKSDAFDSDFAPTECGSVYGSSFAAPDSWYTFTLPDYYEVEAGVCTDDPDVLPGSAASTFDTCLGILDSNQILVAGNDDGTGCLDWSSHITPCCLPPGQYYLVVDGYDAASVGAYDLVVNFAAVDCAPPDLCLNYDPMDTIAITLPVAGQTGTNIGAANFLESDAGDVAYSFSLPTDNNYLEFNSCYAGTDFDLDTYWYKDLLPCDAGYDANVNYLGYNDGGACEFTNYSSHVIFDCNAPLAAGNYFVVVSGYDAAEGNFEFSLAATDCATLCDPVPCTGTDEVEPNNGTNDEPATFDTIACGQTVCGEVSTQASDTTRDTDWFEFTSLDDFSMIAHMEQSAFDGIISLLDSNYDVVGAVDEMGFCEAENLILPCMPAGTYYLVVSPNFTYTLDQVGNYALSLLCTPCCMAPFDCDGNAEVEPNDEVVDAMSINCGDVICGTTTTDMPDTVLFRNFDRFELVIAESMILNVDLVAHRFDGLIQITNDAGVVGTADNGLYCEPESIETLCLEAGVYYILVTNLWDVPLGETRDYSLSVTCTPCELPDFSHCQPGIGGTAGTAEVTQNLQRYESFADAGTINGMDFLGITLFHNGSAWEGCTEDPMTFTVSFLTDNGGLPDAVVYSEVVDISGVATGDTFAGYPIYNFSFVPTTPFDLVNGWVSVQGAGDPDCWILWVASPYGDGSSLLSSGGAAPTVEDFDLNYCIDATPIASCDAVTDMVIEMQSGTANLSWTATAGAVDYRILASENGYDGYVELVASTGGMTSYSDVGATVNNRRFYKVIAVCE